MKIEPIDHNVFRVTLDSNGGQDPYGRTCDFPHSVLIKWVEGPLVSRPRLVIVNRSGNSMMVATKDKEGYTDEIFTTDHLELWFAANEDD